MKTFRIALHALRRNVMRSILTCVGIIIGIAAVIAMAEIGRGSGKAIEDAIARMGANVLQVDPSDVVKAGVRSGAGGKNTLIPDDADAIARECSNIRYVAPSVDCHFQIVYGHKNYAPGNVLGTTPAYLKIRDWGEMAEGSPFTDEDVKRGALVCMIGQIPARVLFDGESPIGKDIRVGTVRLRVVGLLPTKGASVTGRDYDDIVIIPWTTAKFRLSGSRQSAGAQSLAAAPVSNTSVNTLSDLYPSQPQQLYPSKSASQTADLPMLTRFTDLDDIFVSVESADAIEQAKQQITAVLRERHHIPDDAPDDFRMRDWTEITATIATTNALISNLLMIVAMISLIVGGVGIMNIMLVAVTERTREIGIRMAVGARSGDILRQFLIEASILCFAGGLVGIGLERFVSWSVTQLLGWPTLSSVPAIAVAVVVSVLVGLVFGIYPAWKASRLDPIEALRHE